MQSAKIFIWLTAGVAAALLHSAATAQSPLANAGLTITHVAGNVYMIQRPGGGGNIGAQIGPDGVLLVDSLFDPMTDSLLAAVREVTEEDIKYLINTHIHVDHVGGNANLAERGVVIFSHENTRQRFLEERSRFPRAGGSWVPQQPESARPQITFNDEMTFHFNGEEVLTFKVPPCTH